MKNLITIALLLLLTNAYSQEETIDPPIDTHIGIGKWSDCFRRGGICTFEKKVDGKSANSLSVFNEDGTLTVRIRRDQITPVEEFKLLGEELHKESNPEKLTFLMEEELMIPEDVRQALKIPADLTKLM